MLSSDGAVVEVSEGSTYGPWSVLAVLTANKTADGTPGPCIVLEHTFENFGVLQYVGIRGHVLQLINSVGKASTTQPLFNFTGAYPNYFSRATQPDDWLAQRARNDSLHGESNYLESWKYLAASRDYGLLGTPESDMKWVMNHDGRIKRGTQYSAYEPDNASTPLTPAMGVILFDPAKHTTQWPVAGKDFSDRKSGYLRGDFSIRAIAHASYDASSAAGFTMMALSPAAVTVDASPTLLVRIADVNATGLPGPYQYFAISDVNRSSPSGPLCSVPTAPTASTADAVYTALYNEWARWNATLAPAMKLKVPYAERRVANMAVSSITAGLATFLRKYEPNYGTGGYWCVDCRYSKDQPYVPGYEQGNGKGCWCHGSTAQGGSLPLTTLALDSALLEFGMIDEAKAQVGFYFTSYIYDTTQIPGHLTPPEQDVSGRGGCVFGPQMNRTSIHSCAADKCKAYTTLATAESACIRDPLCTGINLLSGSYNTRASLKAVPSPYVESGWLLLNAGKDGCRSHHQGDAGRFKHQLINMEGWKQLPAYNCTLADGVSDYGRLLNLYVKTVRYSRDDSWAKTYLPKAVRMVELLTDWRKMGKLDNPLPSIQHGLIFGPPVSADLFSSSADMQTLLKANYNCS
jgi:hypothetical protein